MTAMPPDSFASRSASFSRSQSESDASISLRICDDPLGDLGGLATAVDDRGGVLVDHDAPGGAEHLEADLVELVAELRGDHLGAGQDRHVLEHRLAPVTEARGLDGARP